MIEKMGPMRYNDPIGLVFHFRGKHRRRNTMNKKAIIIVLDSAGIGDLPDAANYGD